MKAHFKCQLQMRIANVNYQSGSSDFKSEFQKEVKNVGFKYLKLFNMRQKYLNKFYLI